MVGGQSLAPLESPSRYGPTPKRHTITRCRFLCQFLFLWLLQAPAKTQMRSRKLNGSLVFARSDVKSAETHRLLTQIPVLTTLRAHFNLAKRTPRERCQFCQFRGSMDIGSFLQMIVEHRWARLWAMLTGATRSMSAALLQHILSMFLLKSQRWPLNFSLPSTRVLASFLSEGESITWILPRQN